MTRILGIDPGKKRIGVALSDTTGTLASPLVVIQHTSRNQNAQKIIALATENEVGLIVVGQSFDLDGSVSFEGRGSARLAGAIKNICSIPVLLWDESHSTKNAKRIHIKAGSTKKKRRGHLDDQAAAVILQSYLDSHENKTD